MTTATKMSDVSTDYALHLDSLTVGYGPIVVLRDVTIGVPTGSVLAVLGSNGAGKTTLLKAASGLLRPQSGRVVLDGLDMTGAPTHARSRAGLCLVPDSRGVFPNLTVRENLQLWLPPRSGARSHDDALDVFPVLRDRLNQLAGSMSGGQQQMVALARCFLAEPKVVLLDEVSMGLAPIVVEEIFAAIRTLADTGVSLVVVEQYVAAALDMSDHVCVLSRGEVSFSGSPDEIDQDQLVEQYIGAGLAG